MVWFSLIWLTYPEGKDSMDKAAITWLAFLDNYLPQEIYSGQKLWRWGIFSPLVTIIIIIIAYAIHQCDIMKLLLQQICQNYADREYQFSLLDYHYLQSLLVALWWT